MKTCPACAERLQPGAAVCRFCGHGFTEEERRAAERGAYVRHLVRVAPAVALGCFALWMFDSVQDGVAADRVKEVAAAKAAVQDPRPCTRLIGKAQRAGLVRRWARPDEIQVEEAAWDALPADGKRGLMLTLRCHALEGQPDLSSLGLFVRAYGYRSGRQVADASRYGVNLY